MPPRARAEDACTEGGSFDRATRARALVHAPMAIRSPSFVLALPEDVGTLPGTAIRTRLPAQRVPLDVHTHIVNEPTRRIVSFTPSGTDRWSRPFEGEHAAAACGRTVFVYERGRLEAIDTTTGASRWSIALEGHVVRLAAIGCDALVARRASRDTGAYAEVLHVLAASDGRTRTELPCAACLPRMVAEDTYVYSEPGGVRVLETRGGEVRLHTVRLPEDDDVKGRVGDALVTYDEGELALVGLDGSIRFRKRGRVRVLATHDRYVVTATMSAVEVLDPLTGEARFRFTFEGPLAVGLDDTRGVALDETRILLRTGEPLPLEAVLDVAAGRVLSLRALPFSVETTLARGRDVLHGGVEWLLTDGFSESAPLRTHLSRSAERAALVSTVTRVEYEDPWSFVPELAAAGRCAFAERPAMRLALLDRGSAPDDGSFGDAFVRAILAELAVETSGARLLGPALARLPRDVDANVLVALTAWLSRDDAVIGDETYDAWLREAEGLVSSARFVDARAVLTSDACTGETVPESCLRADALFEHVRAAYTLGARTRGGGAGTNALEQAVAARAGAPLAGVNRTSALLRAAARGWFAFDPDARSTPMSSSTPFDFPTAFGVRNVGPAGAHPCGIRFGAPRVASRIERGPVRAAYAVRIENACTATKSTVLVSFANGIASYRGEAFSPPVEH